MSHTTRGPRPRAVLAAATVATSALAVLPATSSADDYVINHCQRGASWASEWTIINSRAQTADHATEGCAAGSDVPVIEWLQSGARPSGALTGWQLDAPEGSGLIFVGWRVLFSAQILSNMTNAIADGVPGGALLCGAGGCHESREGVTPPGWQSTRLRWYMQCDSQAAALPNCSGAGSARLWQSLVTVRDTVPPTGSATGTLLESSPDRPLNGTQVPIAVRAQDAGSGARTVRVEIGDTMVTKTLESCQEPPYRSMQVCPSTVAATLYVDTTKIPDGEHVARVVAVDGSGGERILAQQPVYVQNNPIVGPGSPRALRGAENGAGASDGAQVAVWWPASAKKPSKNRATRRKCKKASYARKHRVLCNGRAPRGVITGTWAKRARYTIAGRLTNAAGAPIAGATMQLLRTPRASGATPQPIGTVTTDSTGRWSALVARADGSAQIAVQYRAFARDTTAQSGGARLTIRSRSTLSIPKTARRAKRVRFSGRLVGTAGSRADVVVSVQVRHRGRWRTVAAPLTNRVGRWSYRHKFAARGTYRFRVVSGVAATYPYASGATRARKIVVR